MSQDLLVTLKIDKVGDLEALNALNALDAKGRRIIEGASGATGRAMGEVALAYERGTNSVRLSLEAVAKEHEKNIRVMQREEAAAERMTGTSSMGLGRIRQGMTSLVAQLTGTTPVLDRVLGAFGGLAVGSLPLIGVLGGIAAITQGYKLLTAQARDAAAQADAMADAFSRVAHMDMVGQAQAATKLYSGDKYAKDPLDRFGISGLKQQQQDLEARVKAGTSRFYGAYAIATTQMTTDASAAYDQLQKVKKKLAEIEPIYSSVMGAGGSFADAAARQVAGDQPGFATDALRDSAKGRGRAGAPVDGAARLAKQQAAAYQRELAKDLREATRLAVKEGVDNAETSYTASQSVLAELIPSKKQIDDAMKEVGHEISEAIANDPVLAAAGAVAQLNEQLTHILQDGLAQSIVGALDAGFETAFSGSGATGFIEGFGRAVLGALGGVMQQMGAALLSYGIAMELVALGLTNPFTSGPAAIAAGTLLVGLGAALKAAARGHGGSVGGGGYSSASGGGLAQIIDRGVINPDSYSRTSASSIAGRQTVTANFTVIGPNDPNAVRGIDEILRRINQRGSLAGAAA